MPSPPPQAQAIYVPPAPPNPPMFGSSTAAGARQRSQAASATGFGSTILGADAGGNPTNTAQKTLLGA